MFIFDRGTQLGPVVTWGGFHGPFSSSRSPVVYTRRDEHIMRRTSARYRDAPGTGPAKKKLSDLTLRVLNRFQRNFRLAQRLPTTDTPPRDGARGGPRGRASLRALQA